MADKKNQPIIIIKKIKKGEAGHHGGSWKVAFADFMTAMMAFFLVMWLISQSEEVKKEIADHFSTPSVVEYNFKNYGALLTLEKLFVDLVSDPLKFFESFIRPKDYAPDIMNLGSQKVAENYMIEQLEDFAKNIQTDTHSISFDIPDYHLFVTGTAKTEKNFVNIISKIQALSSGLKDSDIQIHSQIHIGSLDDSSHPSIVLTQGEKMLALNGVAETRMMIVSKAIQKSLEHPSVEIYGKTSILDPEKERRAESVNPEQPYSAWIKFEILKRQKVKKILKEKISESKRKKGLFQKNSHSFEPSNRLIHDRAKKEKWVQSLLKEKEKKWSKKSFENEKKKFESAESEKEKKAREKERKLEAFKRQGLRNRNEKMNPDETRFDPFTDPFKNPLNDVEIQVN